MNHSIMLDTKFNFLLLTKIEGCSVIAREIARHTTKTPNIMTSTLRASITNLITITAFHTGIIWNIHCKIRNVMIHCIVHNCFQRTEIILYSRIEFYIRDAACA